MLHSLYISAMRNHLVDDEAKQHEGGNDPEVDVLLNHDDPHLARW